MNDTDKPLSEILPCPFCGSSNVGRAKDDPVKLRWLYVHCNECGASSMRSSHQERADAAWNRRAHRAAATQGDVERAKKWLLWNQAIIDGEHETNGEWSFDSQAELLATELIAPIRSEQIGKDAGIAENVFTAGDKAIIGEAIATAIKEQAAPPPAEKE